MIGAVLSALGRVYGGAAEAVGDAILSGASVIGRSFSYRPMDETLAQGNIIPFKMNTGVKRAAFAGFVAIGIGNGIMNGSGVNEETATAPNSGYPSIDIPNTVGRYTSPTRESMAAKRGIDDMGATGDLVLALNNNRR